jgi:hypothetical protein
MQAASPIRRHSYDAEKGELTVVLALPSAVVAKVLAWLESHFTEGPEDTQQKRLEGVSMYLDTPKGKACLSQVGRHRVLAWLEAAPKVTAEGPSADAALTALLERVQ